MGDLYNRLREQADGINDYTAQVKVNIYGGSKEHDIEHDPTVMIPFALDIEYRDYGIKSIDILATSTISIPYAMIAIGPDGQEGERQEQTLKIDLSTAETEWVAGGFFGISEIDIALTPEGSVANVKLVCVYLEKGS